jgi:hypothetical protein
VGGWDGDGMGCSFFVGGLEGFGGSMVVEDLGGFVDVVNDVQVSW